MYDKRLQKCFYEYPLVTRQKGEQVKKYRYWVAVVTVGVLLNATLTLANGFPAKIELKSGRQIEVVITEVDYWGMWLKSNQGLSYKVIGTLTTKNRQLMTEIQSYVQDLNISSEDDEVSAEFSEASFPPVLDKHPGVFRSHSYTLSALSSRGDNLSVKLTRVPRSIDWLAFQFSFDQGWYTKYLNYNISRISLGFGLRYPMVNQDIMLMANVSYIQSWQKYPPSRKYDARYPAGTKEQASYFLSADYRRYLFSRPFYLSLGARVYLTNIPIAEKTTRASINLGVGYTFRY